MEGLFILIVLALIALPLILSIVAMVIASGARSETRLLREYVRRLQAGEAPAAKPEPGRPAAVKKTGEQAPVPEAKPEKKKAAEIFQPAEPLAAGEKPPPPLPAAAVPRAGSSAGLEVALGGKVASFIGIAALVLGVVFFVGYAIKENLIGPGMRIVLGLVFGGILIALGHLAEIKGKQKLGILARALTGGGSALLFFSVFAAHGIYDLIGAWPALGGLLAVALAVLGLSVVYRSQTVAILGVLGAFITPLLIGGEFNTGIFPLLYIAAVNVVVMVLGVRRNWQSLYNIGFAFTVLYGFLWLDRQVVHGDAETNGLIGLAFTALYFAQFIALGLVKLKGERGGIDQVIDMGRMLLSSLLLMGVIYLVFDELGWNQWIGAAFLGAAVLHLALVKLAWRWLPRFKNDILVLIAGAVSFATLALPAQLDGVWVSLGWSIEGLVLAWMSARYRVTAFRLAGIFLGLIGLGKSLGYDLRFYQGDDVRLFFNARFVVSMLAAGLLGLQAWICGRGNKQEEGRPAGGLRVLEDLVMVVACLGFVFAVGFDAIDVLHQNVPWAWMSSSVALAIAGAFLLVFAANREDSQVLWACGIGLLVLLPIKLLLIDYRVPWLMYDRDFAQFFNTLFVTGLVLCGVIILLGIRYGESDHQVIPGLPAGPLLIIISLVTAILLVTMEISRAANPWKDSAITLWWGGCALLLIFLGLRFGRRYLRYTALALFGVTIIKVFLVDLSGLGGLVRVAAFMGVGLLLLVLSFTYQRLAPKLTGTPAPEPPTTPDEPS